jgi:hypothetical protein
VDKEALSKILERDIIPTLTDMKNGQLVFWKAFDQNKSFGTPIKTVLELGIMRLKPSVPHEKPGQSTKTLISLGAFYGMDKYVSLDIDNCRCAINFCTKWCKDRGAEVSCHKFVQSNSLEFDVTKEFPNGVDFIFLDTNHDDNYPERIGYPNSGGAGMTYREICYYARHLTKNGRMFVHDTQSHYVPKEYGVNTDGAVTRFIDENSNYLFREHMPNRIGLGEIYRKDSDVAKYYNAEDK